MADMSTAMQMASAPRAPAPPQGGLTQATQAQMPAPTGSSTGAAQSIDNINNVIQPGMEGAANLATSRYAKLLDSYLAEGLPSLQENQRAAKLAREKWEATMQPEELSGMDLLARGATAGIANNPALLEGGNFGAMLASMGAGVDATRQKHMLSEQTKAKALFDSRQGDFEQQEKRMLDIGGKSALLGGGGRQSGVRFKYSKNADGTTTVFDTQAGGGPIGTYGPQDISKISNMAQMLAKAAFEKGDYATLDEALAWAQAEAFKQVAGMNAAVGNRTAPLQGNVGGVPAVAQPGAPAAQPQAIQAEVPTAPTGAADVFKIDTSRWTPDERAAVQGQIEAYKKSPTPETRARVEAYFAGLNKKYASPTDTPATNGDTPVMKKLDPAVEAGRKKEAERQAEVRTAKPLKAQEEVGKAEGVRAGAKPDEVVAARTAVAQIDRLEKALISTMGMPGLDKTHGLSGYIPFIGDVATARGTEAQDYKSKLVTLRAQIGFEALQAMRDASKTGGALGNVTEKEIDFLQNSLDAIDTRMSDEEAKKSYNNILAMVQDMRKRVTENFLTKYPQGNTPADVLGGEKTREVNGKIWIKRADGKWYPK